MVRRKFTAAIRAFALSLAGVALTACASNDIRWTEEVKLSDGRVIELQRRVELTASGFPAQERGFVKYVEICYAPLKLRWRSLGAYVPDVLDIVDGKAYMHVPIGNCGECRALGYPDPNALHFVWENGAWKRIRHDEFPAASEWNLLRSFANRRPQEDPRGLITLQEKERREYSVRDEQRRFGWRRMHERYLWRDACKQCGAPKTNESFSTAREIFDPGGDSCTP